MSTKRPHGESAMRLLLIGYLVLMSFFAVVRLFGVLYFQAEAPTVDIPVWAGNIIAITFGALSIFTVIGTIVEVSTIKNIVISFLTIGIVNIIAVLAPTPAPFIDTLLIVLVSLCIGGFSRQNARRSIFITIAILLYQVVFILYARGYPSLAAFCPVWIIFGTMDYYLFLIALYLTRHKVREVIDNERLLGLFQRGKRYFRNRGENIPKDSPEDV